MTERPGDTLSRLCRGARRLVVAAPYIKADALKRVLSEVSPAATLICVTRWNPQDIVAGASDTQCRDIVKEFGGSFRLHPTLHAKYYQIDDTVLIGSANLTAPALGWSSQPNLEILCRPSNDFDACAFREKLLRESREISDYEFLRWQAIVRISAENDNPTANVQPQLDAWRPATRDPRHLMLSYQGKEEEIASSDEQGAARRDIQALQIPPGLTGEQVHSWISACLLAAPFTNTVMRLHGTDDASSLLAGVYSLGIGEARRDMETVLNWLAYLSPDILKATP